MIIFRAFWLTFALSTVCRHGGCPALSRGCRPEIQIVVNRVAARIANADGDANRCFYRHGTQPGGFAGQVFIRGKHTLCNHVAVKVREGQGDGRERLFKACPVEDNRCLLYTSDAADE